MDPYLSETFLSGPHWSMDNLQEELTGPGIEDEDSTVDWFGGQVPLERLVDGDTIYVGVVHKPNDLVGE